MKALTPSEQVAFGISVLVAIIFAAVMAAMLWRTYLGYRPSREFALDLAQKGRETDER